MNDIASGRKRKRCGVCDGCTADDCSKCRFCMDKPKFGGKGVLKQCCISRKCKRLRTDLKGICKTYVIV